MEIQGLSHSYEGRLSRDALVPHHTSDGFDLAPGGAMAREVERESAVGTKYASARLRRWNQWNEFCALGDGQGNEYELYSVSQSKWKLFSGWLADGVSEDKDLNTWRSAINHYFAEAEKGRPLKGFDVNNVIKGHGVLLTKRKVAAGKEMEQFRVGTNKLHIQRLQALGMVVTGRLLSIIGLLLNMSIFGYRAATAGGYLPGDSNWVNGRSVAIADVLVFLFRSVKKRPELRWKPEPRMRTMPFEKGHPLRLTMQVIKRAMTADPDALGVAARECRLSSKSTAADCERLAAPLITKWMRDIFGEGTLGVPKGLFIASHSWRIMLASACQAIKCDLDFVCIECFWMNRSSMEPYLKRKIQYDHFWDRYFDFLQPKARR